MEISKRLIILILALTLFIAIPVNVVFAAPQNTTEIINLKTEDLINPIGIDSIAPSFSWQMDSDVIGQKQTEYQLIVAKTSNLEQPVWNSGKTNDGHSVGIKYAGAALVSSTTYYWQVTVWDKDGVSIKSAIATFETGLFGANAWDDSEWIQVGISKEEPPASTGPLNYTLEVDFQIVKPSATAQSAVGFVFEASDEDHFLMWQFSANEGNIPGLYFRPHVRNAGWTTPPQQIVTDKAAGDQTNLDAVQHLKIVVANDKIRTFLNGHELNTIEKSSLNGIGFGSQIGKFGFRSSGIEKGFLDNIVLTDNSVSPAKVTVYNFDDGINPMSNGTIVDNKLDIQPGGAGDLIGLASSNGANFVNYIVEADITCSYEAIGIVFNAKDTNNFYMWQLNTKDDARKVMLRPHTWKNGVWATYDQSHKKDVTAAVGGYNTFKTTAVHIKIEVTNSEIKTTIGGVLVDTFPVGTLSDQGTSGIPVNAFSIGLRTGHSAEEGTIDNFKLTDYSQNISGDILFDFDFNGSNPFSKGNIVNGAFVAKDVGIILPLSDGASTFRKEFTPGSNLASAKFYITGLGVFDAFINGQRVGHLTANNKMIYDELKPGYTTTNSRDVTQTRVNYYTYDITKMIATGKNTISAIVSSGWWLGQVNGYVGSKSALRAQILLTYNDGTTEIIGTDQTWKTANVGPIVMADIYQGETYNANADISYRKNNFDDSDWFFAEKNTEFNGVISAPVGPNVRVREELTLTPETIVVYQGISGATASSYGKVNVLNTYTGNKEFTLQPGQTAIFDLGQNFAGWDELELEGNAGTKDAIITMRHSEILNDNGDKNRGDGAGGSVYLANLRGAAALGTYIMSDKPIQKYHATHTYYGFRYVEVTTTKAVKILGVKGLVVNSVEETTGTLETSNKDVNQLISNILWGQYSNYVSVPTDCPQRDERSGWLGDTQAFSTTAAYNANSKGFLMKFLEDLRDSQSAAGRYPDVAPRHPAALDTSNFGWSDAGIIVPYNLYKMYGDKDIIANSYSSMEKYMNSIGIEGAGLAYGDWLAPGGGNSERQKELLAAAYYAWDTQMMAEMANALGKTADVTKYQNAYAAAKAAFISNFVDSDGYLVRDEQTSCLLALKADLLPNEQSRELVKKALLDNIEKNGDKLQTGFLGTSIIMTTLSEIGASDVAYKLLLQHGYPSWLYSVDNGATTIWERWNSYTKEHGLRPEDAGMNSFNHYAYGAVGEWMYSDMAGIKNDISNPGFYHINLVPSPNQSLSYVKGSYHSAYGTIFSNWRYDNSQLLYNAKIPANTTATISVPVETGKEITVNGKASDVVALEADGIKYVETIDGRAVFEAVAGTFKFATAVTIDENTPPNPNPDQPKDTNNDTKSDDDNNVKTGIMVGTTVFWLLTLVASSILIVSFKKRKSA